MWWKGVASGDPLPSRTARLALALESTAVVLGVVDTDDAPLPDVAYRTDALHHVAHDLEHPGRSGLVLHARYLDEQLAGSSGSIHRLHVEAQVVR